MAFAAGVRLPSSMLPVFLGVLAGVPPLLPALAGPLPGALRSPLGRVDLASAPGPGAATLLAPAWITAPALSGVAVQARRLRCAIVLR